MGAVRQALDLIQPRALGWSFLRGSWVLLCLLAGLIRSGLRRATSSTAAPAAPPPAPKGPPAKVSIRKTDAPPAEGEEDAEEAGEEPPAKTVKGKAAKVAAAARAGGDSLQNGALLIIVLLVIGGGLSSVTAALLYLLRPYMTIVGSALILIWFFAALTADAVTRPEDDHEEDAGEDLHEEETGEDVEEVEADAPETPAEDPWPAQRDLLRKYVEHRVTACASGLKQGLKGRGARVDDLLAEQQENGGLIGFDRKAMITLLEKAGIRVREQMKFRVQEETEAGWKWVQKNVPGVHIQDLAEDLGRNPNMPAHLVPDHAPGAPPVLPEETPRNVVPIPLARAAGE